jgi:hypothetical protein
LALNYLGRSQWDKGVSIFKTLGSTPNEPLFFFIRGILFKKRGIQGYQKDLQYAYKMDPKNWRFGFALAEDLLKSNDTKNALSIIRKIYEQNPKNYFAGVLLIKILNARQDYDKAIDLLQDLRILPYEHASEGRYIYTQAYVGSAQQKISKGVDSDKATKQLDKALLWPENLGVGKPFDPEERWERFLLAYLHQKKGNKKASKMELDKILNYSLTQLSNPSENHLLGIYAIQQIQGEEKAKEFIAQLLESKHGSSSTTKNLIQFYYNNLSIAWNREFINKIVAFLK